MCGIAGLLVASEEDLTARAEAMAAALAHRGPDAQGFYHEPGLALVHTRLSIIDLNHGDQPLYLDERRYVLVANGEIYNYVELQKELEAEGCVFSTRSDCEVILHGYVRYGDAFIERLRGMFAFALYDRKDKRLLLARDRLGIKPLFIFRRNGELAFASELKPLMAAMDWSFEVNSEGLAQYLQNQFSAGETTVIKDVVRLPPATAIAFRNGQEEKRWCYWDLQAIEPTDISEGEALEQFDVLMNEAMTQHMRSDVPFGLFLSGGVDSSILAALLHQHGQEKLKTFSVNFKEENANEELQHANAIAHRFGCDHTVLQPGRDQMFQRLGFSVWAADDLMRDYANLPTNYLAEYAGESLKVVFSGEGGDEVFAGYGRYRASPVEMKLKALLHPGSEGFRTSQTFSSSWQRRLCRGDLAAAMVKSRAPFVDLWQSCPSPWSRLQKMQYTDIKSALPDNLLVKADRLLMAWSVEGRVPFLDHRLVEFGLSLPDHLKTHDSKRYGLQGKWLLKKWASKMLPEDVLMMKKRGFRVPVKHWISDEFCARLNRVLPQHPCLEVGFNRQGVSRLLTQKKRTADDVRMIWSLLQFALWWQFFVESRGARPDAEVDPISLLSSG